MENDASSYKKAVGIAVAITAIGIIIVINHYRQISGRTGTIVIPAGNTYLGPSPTPSQPASASAVQTVTGRIYPYTFDIPASITLTTFPNDPYDMYAVAGPNPSANVIIGIDTKANPSETKSVYINAWWKQFTSLTGVKSIEPFTNKNGLRGYTVKFLNTAGQSPNTDVFFEVPDHPEYVIHLSNGILDPAVFTKITDSLGWNKQ